MDLETEDAVPERWRIEEVQAIVLGSVSSKRATAYPIKFRHPSVPSVKSTERLGAAIFGAQEHVKSHTATATATQ